MADASTFLMGESRSRRIKDTVARYSVTAGGISVLVALILIFFYLLYVITPIFAEAKVEPRLQFSLPMQGETLALGMEEQNEVAFRFSGQGELAFIRLTEQGKQAGKIIDTIGLASQPTSFAASLPSTGIFAYGHQDGTIRLIKPRFRVSFSNDQRSIVPEVGFPFGELALVLDPKGQAVTQLAFSVQESTAVVIGQTEDQRLILARYDQREDHRVEQSGYHELAEVPEQITAMVVTPNGKLLYLLSNDFIYVIELDGAEPRVRQVVDVSYNKAKPVALDLLSGANSLLITTADNTVTQWFEVMRDGRRQLVRVREFFSAGVPVAGAPADENPLLMLVPEYYRKGFFALQQDGTVSSYYTTSHNLQFSDQLVAGTPVAAAVSPRADGLLVITGDNWQLFSVRNSHPEISLSALWQKVWYEGYPEPDYVWQSTSASDEFEPKLSLVPIVFGTLKAALYALVFAVPIAVAGAIYTAYFMSSRMRGFIKPTVEIMEALPTVILGFLAGLWLAPLVEQNLPAVLLLLVMSPISVLLVGGSWVLLPDKLRFKIPNGWHVVLLIPVIILVGYGCFALSPYLEQWLFDGDVRVYLTSELGIGFDQRNALVVGLAMGFAVIPTIFSIAEDAIFSVPSHLTNGSLALGATHWQTLTKVVLLTASPGIFSAIMMGLGRAVGETMIVLMATGNTPIMDWNIFQGLRTLSANIAVEMPESEVGSSHYRVLFLAAFVLFLFTFAFNTVAELVRQRLREKYSSL